MYSMKRKDLGDGVIKAINNAKELASSLDEPSHSSSKSAHARSLAEVGLEEIAKASLLFEKYVIAMMDGKASFDKAEHGFISGSRTAHFKRIERIHHLYALLTQLAEWPGTSVFFTESIEDILVQRNRGLYVDYDENLGQFVAPGEPVENSFFTTTEFLGEVLNYTRYDLAIAHLALLLGQKRKFRLQVLDRIDEELSAKQNALDQEIADFLSSNSLAGDSPFADRSRALYIAYPIVRGGVSIAYTVFRPHKDGGAFLMDNAPNQLMIDSTGSIRHYILANNPKINDGLMRIQWQEIQAFD